MIETDIIFSINVHQDIDFLLSQIINIDEYVDLNYIIILNANEYMYHKLKINKIINKINFLQINPVYFNKKIFHGSLTKGIFSNMEFVMNKYNFKYFIVLSSRNLFYNKLNKKTCNFSKICAGFNFNNINIKEWFWHSFVKTDLSKYIIKNKLLFSASAHEGLTFDYISCKKIILFLNKNNSIKKNLFNWNHCVEEFALQTICINLTGYYYYLGNGTGTNNNVRNLPKNKFVYKTVRYQTIKEENETIKEENETIKEENETIKKENQTLKKENQTLKKENETIKKENETIKKENQTIKKKKIKL